MTSSKMKFTLALALLLIALSPAFSQRKIEQLADDKFEIVISRSPSSPIKILQVTDLHLGSTDEGKWEKDIITFRRIKQLVDTYDPDMIAITGDLLTGEKPFGSLLCASVVNFFDGLERPWLYVFGNHDPEGGFGRDQIAEVFSVSKWGILGNHPVDNEYKKKYDYVVNLNYIGESKPAWQIYGFDSGSKKGFKSIKQDQLDWYINMSEKSDKEFGQKSRAIAIFHIPLMEYQYLQDDKTIKKYGDAEEKVWYEEDDGSVYKTFLDIGNIEATFCGHDHYNNYWGEYKGGITLAYGYISGEATKYAYPPGGKLITLPGDGGDITMENVAPDYKNEDYEY